MHIASLQSITQSTQLPFYADGIINYTLYPTFQQPGRDPSYQIARPIRV
jgi:hypothetical protein